MRKAVKRLQERGAKMIQDSGNPVIIHLADEKASAVKEPAKTYGKSTRNVRYYGRIARRRSTIHQGITFKELSHFLVQHGFEQVRTAGLHKVYREKSSDAMVVLPAYKDSDEIRPFHLATVRKLLVERGLVSRKAMVEKGDS
ncbi:MAG TPA: hypothetical protein VGK74_06700 [Symbiobacteriaceae bacterium]|jgi:predicted RNA binding protein YcfA (HicA-like mRNA interferase family)